MSRTKIIVNESALPNDKIENLARVLLPDILEYYYSEIGRNENEKENTQNDKS